MALVLASLSLSAPVAANVKSNALALNVSSTLANVAGDTCAIESHRGNRVKIVGRSKEQFKLSQGEYIVPTRCEEAYAKSDLVETIFVHGDGTQSNVVGIICPSLALEP